jgi:predicted nucleic acid-binding protein
MKVVVDSSVWISVLRDADSALFNAFHRLSVSNAVVVGDLIMLELLSGSQSESAARTLEAQLNRFEIVEMLNRAIALKAAANHRALRAQGLTIRKTVDLIIGTYCIEHGHALLHRDRDFSAMEKHLGLKVV